MGKFWEIKVGLFYQMGKFGDLLSNGKVWTNHGGSVLSNGKV
jgi:hypothetical protein